MGTTTARHFNGPGRLGMIVTVCLALMLALPSASYGAKIKASGQIANGFTSVSISVTVQNVAPALLTPDANAMHRHIDLVVPSNNSLPLLHAAAPSDDGSHNPNFYWTLKSSPNKVGAVGDDGKPLNNGNFDITFSLTVLQNTGFPNSVTLQSVQDTSNANAAQGINFTANFLNFANGAFSANATYPVTVSFAATLLTGVPLEAPELQESGVIPSFRTIGLNWTAKNSDGTVPYSYPVSDPPTTSVPPQVLVMVFYEDAGSLTLPASQVKTPKTGETVATTCEYTPPTSSGGSCITCNKADSLPDAELKTNPISVDAADPDLPGVFKFTLAPNTLATNSLGSHLVQGLEVNEKYVVVMQYEKGGERSACFISEPSNSVSLTEYNGGSDAILKNPSCFIATAAFGTPQHQHIGTLIWFRENFMRAFTVGTWLIDLYNTYSPPIAAVVAESSWLRAVVRGLIFVPATYLGWVRKLGHYPLIYVNSVGLVIMMGLGALLGRRRFMRRKRIW
jgi:hypothetical protein